MTEETKTDFTPNPDGSVKIVHATLESIKLKAKNMKNTFSGKLLGGHGEGIKILATSKPQGPQLKGPIQLSKNLFEGKAGEMPDNIRILEACERAAEEGWEDEDVTLTFTMKGGYWGLTNFEKGHIGYAKVYKPGEVVGAAPESKSGGGGYDPSGPIKGKIENWAVALTVANKGKGAVTLEDVLETLEGFKPDTIKALSDAVDATYDATYGKGGGATKNAEKASTEAPEPAEDEELDEDVDF